MPQLSFHPGFNGIMLLVMAVAAFVLVALFYRRAYRSLLPKQWWRLYLLRVAAIVFVLLLLFRPVLSFHREITEKLSLVFLIDTSASMSIADDPNGATRLEHAQARLLEWQQRLEDDFQLHFVAFADSPTVLESEAGLAGLKPTGQATSLTRVLAEARVVAPAKNTEAVFLLSDGIHNAAGDPLEAAQRLGLRLHSVGTGNSLRDRHSYRDVRVTDFECPDQLSLNNRARLTAYVDAVGMPGRVMRVVFAEDGQPVGEAEVVLDNVEGSQEVTVDFLPETKGLHSYSVEVPAAPEEKIVQNNRRQTSSLVVESRIRVLYVEGTLRSEYGALVGRFLAKDPDLEFCALVQTRPNHFVQRTNIEGLDFKSIPEDEETLETFDVFLLGDLDSTYLKSEQMQLIRKCVEDGAGLLMMGGYHSLGPGGYDETPLEDVLPVFVGSREIGQITDTFQPILTPDGRRHAIFANITQFFPTKDQPAQVDGLPPLEGCVRVQGPKPGATVLATGPGETDEPPAVMAVHRFGKGRAAVFTGDTTRNWHQTLRTLDRESPFLRFWGQSVRWLAGRSEEVETEAGIKATVDKTYYEPGSKITITATVRGKEGEGVGPEKARVTATIKGPEMGTVLGLIPEPGPAGNYRLEYEPEHAGTYEIQVEALFGETIEKIAADKLVVDVGRPNLEFDRLDLDDKTLTAIANTTGGRYAHITTADQLIDRLQRTLQSREVTSEVALAWPPLFWVCFVGVLSGEWLLRRRYQLR